jgi:hypothetical protein
VKKNGMQISGKDIENLLVNMVLENKKTKKRHKSKKTQFHAPLLGNGLNKW